MLKFSLLFTLYLAVLFFLELLTPVAKHVVVPWTSFLADACGWLLRLFDSDVVTSGNIIRSATTGFAISIERGCNGVEAVIILVSAILAYPAHWREKLGGIVAGFFWIQALNFVRIISLYYLGNWNYTWFEWFHLYVWQALIVVDALVFFLIWLSWTRRRELAGGGGGSGSDGVDVVANPA